MEFYGENTNAALRAAMNLPIPEEKKSIVELITVPGIWSGWYEIYTQFGVLGSNRKKHVTKVAVSFQIKGRHESSFDIELKGGDTNIRAIGPSRVGTTITGNVATSIYFRLRSHST